MSYNNNQGFFYNFRRTVYKWWCVVYKPAYKLFHHGYWPAEKEPYYQPPKEEPDNAAAEQSELATVAEGSSTNTNSTDAQALANKIMSSKQGNIDDMVANTSPVEADSSSTAEAGEPEIDLSQVDADALARANEIMARLASEAAEDEAKKQAEIAAAKSKAAEEARLAAILKSTKVDISAFIEEGKANRQDANS